VALTVGRGNVVNHCKRVSQDLLPLSEDWLQLDNKRFEWAVILSPVRENFVPKFDVIKVVGPGITT
jgi:hypothetical protein